MWFLSDYPSAHRPRLSAPSQRFRSADAPTRLGRGDGRWPSVLGIAGTSLVLLGTAFVPVASAASTVDLNTAAPFAVLAYSAVTDVPTSSITGDVGLSPAAGSDYAGSDPG